MKFRLFTLFLFLIFPFLTFSATIGLMSDGDDNTGPHATKEMTEDIDNLKRQLPHGWDLDSINFLGDISYGNNNSVDAVSAWEDSSVSDIPLFLILGNHEAETPEDVKFHRAYFEQYPNLNLKKAIGIKQGPNTNYSYDVGDIHVSVVNQYVTDNDDFSSDGFIHNDVFEWLKDDIRNATTTHKAVLAHEPMYPSGRHLGGSLDKYPDMRDKFANLLASYGVIAHAVGHTHYSGLDEISYDQASNRPTVLGGGLWEINTGVFGTKILESVSEGFPSLGYIHSNSSKWGDYEIMLVQANPSWDSPIITKKSHKDLDRQILVNTWDGSGTGSTENGLFDMKYYVDYTDKVSKDPDWFEFNNGKWWELDFDAEKALWKSGELSVGYDSNGLSDWGWINTPINSDPTETGEEQVWGIFGRVTFQASKPELHNSLYLDLDWEDSVHVWLNGVEIFKNGSSIETPKSGEGSEYFNKGGKIMDRVNPLGKSQRTPKYHRLNISQHMDLIKDGENVLAYMSNNVAENPELAYTSSDSALAIRLFMEGQKIRATSPVLEEESFWSRVMDVFINRIKNPLVVIGVFAIMVSVFIVLRYFYVKYL